jgi:arylsulfatase A-like enzyme
MASKTHIVFVHVDQLTWQAISANGNRFARTPNIDRIIADGTSFDAARSATPICCPARSSWYTGRMPSEHGVITNRGPVLASAPDLGQWLQKHHRCLYLGKWHVPGRDVEKSFTLLEPFHIYGERCDTTLAAGAAGILEKFNGRKPLFLNVGLLNPHDCCYQCFAPDMPPNKVGVTSLLHDELPPVPPGCDPSKPVDHARCYGPGRWSEDRLRLYAYYYYRQAEMVDAEVGRIYDAWRNSRFAENGLFIFAADHGEMLGAQNHLTKGVLYEPACHVPLVLVGNGIAKGRRDASHRVTSVDITATILDAAGAKPMPKMTYARSLLPLCGDHPDATPWRDSLVAENRVGGLRRAIYFDHYKAVLYQDGRSRLHDLQADPHELNDLAQLPTSKPLLARARDLHNHYVDTIELHPQYAESFGKIQGA